MKLPVRRIVKWTLAALALLLLAGIVAPYFTADRYGERLRASLERALGRRVEFRGAVRFSLFQGPGLSVDNVVIYEDPAIGLEPIAYVTGGMEVRPRIWSLLGGRFRIASVRLDDASINLTKSGPAASFGRWNFSSFIDRSVMSNVPAIHVRNGRINFKFGDTKSVFYLTETDLDILPPGSRTGGWSLYCSAKPARTDRAAQGLGSFVLEGRWYLAPERLDLNLTLDRTGLGELTALVRGQTGNVHGTLSSRLHLGGPIDNVGVRGRLTVEDVHRWDLLPPHGQGWPIDVYGRIDLVSQQIELQTSSAENATPPISARFRVSDYLSQPRWAVAVNWNRFAVEPLMELAVHMGAQFPPKLKLSGTMDGAIGYSSEGTFQGQLAFHDTALTIPDSPPIAFEHAYLIADHGHIRLSPAQVRTTAGDLAEIEADYKLDSQVLDLAISTEAMKVSSLRAQVALATVPWLEQVRSGQWSGNLKYHVSPAEAGWAGDLEIADSEIAVPGLADPVLLASARARLDGLRVLLDQIEGSAGKVRFTGSYSYEPTGTRHHHTQLRFAQLDAADLEAELLPTLRRSRGLIARALGRTAVPAWLSERNVDGRVQIDDLLVAGVHVQNLRARLIWDVARAEFDNLQARLGRAVLTGRLVANLRGARPSYRLSGKVKGLEWQSGKIDAEGTLETSGTGAQLLANLTTEAKFTSSALDFGTVAPWRNVSGSANLAWSPKLSLTGLSLRTEDDAYTGRGTTQDDGRLVVMLSNGSKEMRMSGTLDRLRIEEPPKAPDRNP